MKCIYLPKKNGPVTIFYRCVYKKISKCKVVTYDRVFVIDWSNSDFLGTLVGTYWVHSGTQYIPLKYAIWDFGTQITRKKYIYLYNSIYYYNI